MTRKEYRRRIVMCKYCSGYSDCVKDGFSLWPLDDVNCSEYEPLSFCSPSIEEFWSGWAIRAALEQCVGDKDIIPFSDSDVYPFDMLLSHPSELELVGDIREEGVVL